MIRPPIRLAMIVVAGALLASAPREGSGRPGASPLGPYRDTTPYTPEEREALSRLKEDQAVFKRGAQVFKNTVSHLIERAYLNEKAELEKRYRGGLEEASRAAQNRRIEAIKEYEAFVKRHPGDEVWTPDVLLRLAELYFEKSEIDFKYAERAYGEKLRENEEAVRLGAKEPPPVPTKPVKDYSACVATYRELLIRFPRYKNRDMVIYALGFVLRLAAQEVAAADDDTLRETEQTLHHQARQAFLGLVCANKYQPLDKPTEPVAPAGYEVSPDKPVDPAALAAPFEGFDPYKDCRSVIELASFQGAELERRRYLLSQSWFFVGEEHFDADPKSEFSDEDLEAFNKKNQGYRGPDREREIKRRGYEWLNEKKLRLLRVHNYYAISAYTRVADQFKDSKEYNSSLYKRAWTYFKIDQYVKALNEFDDLLVTAKEKDLQDNAVRYLALCAFYQKDADASGRKADPFVWLKNYYTQKGWIGNPSGPKHDHVKAAFHQLAEVLYEEAAPPSDDPGPENYNHELLLRAMAIYTWLLDKGGFADDAKDPTNAEADWKYYRGRALIQWKVLQIMGLLSVNLNAPTRALFPRAKLYRERKAAFDRFSALPGGPHTEFAKEYEKRWGADKEVSEALLRLREDSLMAMGKDFYDEGGTQLEAYQKLENEAKRLTAQRDELLAIQASRKPGFRTAPAKIRKIEQRLALIKPDMDRLKGLYQANFSEAGKAFKLIAANPQYANTLTAYDALFFGALATYFGGNVQEAAAGFKEVQNSKISARHAKEAAKWRLGCFGELVKAVKLPPDPDPAKDKTVTRMEMPPLLVEYHGLLRELIAKDPTSPELAVHRYTIALHHFLHRQFAEAKPLFEEMLERHCEARQAFYAGQHLLVMLELEKGEGYLDKLEALASRIKSKACGTKVQCAPGDEKCGAYLATVKAKQEDLEKIGPFILRERAFKAYDAKEYEKAATYFGEIIRRYPDSKEIALFLYNAAFSYEKINKFTSAKNMYELIFTKYKELAAKTPIKDDKGKIIDPSILDNVAEFLARVALKALDYETALKYYGVLATDPAFAAMEGRVAWYYQYARLLKFHGRYDEAVTYFREKYAKEVQSKLPQWKKLAQSSRDPEDKKKYQEFVKEAEQFLPRADLELGKIRERQGKWIEALQLYQGYITYVERTLEGKLSAIQKSPTYYKDKPDDRENLREMMALLGLVLQKQTEWKASRKTLEKTENQILENCARFKVPVPSAAGRLAAGIAFGRIEGTLDKFKTVKYVYAPIKLSFPITLAGVRKPGAVLALTKAGQETVAKALKTLNDKVGEYTKIYLETAKKYLDDEWAIAFNVHIGKIYEMAASQVSDPKYPDVVEKFINMMKKAIEAGGGDAFEFEERVKQAVFTNTLTNANQTWDKLAKEAYRASIKLGQDQGIANDWTRLARKYLSAIDPNSPYVNEPKVEPAQ